MNKQYFVYILTNWNNAILYIGMTSNLPNRIYQHKNKVTPGFTEKYNVNKLVYYEIADDAYTAVSRERQLKGWLRSKKLALVSSSNPQWLELVV